MSGWIHIYYGDGKGKTTAAIGLAIRAAGAGKRVLFAQFFKDGRSSEIRAMQALEQIRTVHCGSICGIWSRMDDAQKELAAREYPRFLADVLAQAADADLLVMDEIVSACNHGALSEEAVLDFLRGKPEELEVVLTGRNPSSALLAVAG